MTHHSTRTMNISRHTLQIRALTCRPTEQFNQNQKEHTLNWLGRAQRPVSQARLQTKLYPKIAYKTSNYDKSNKCNKSNFCQLPELFILCHTGLLNCCDPCMMTFSSDSINM